MNLPDTQLYQLSRYLQDSNMHSVILNGNINLVDDSMIRIIEAIK